ncbi:winged helix DNA-binding domain-containing protein [Cellulomonas sp. APG4]|uniref:winged helix DNA-binding domain-containing protein n=1 Tax=Cellulomonas sp. APG4 TaxID=1538656 RepID=UPI00137A5379|nr:winged helix DNA-binding domain-containing protein [Cellulomonas sp. APG4]NCT91419.1 winged helix DNA-binding domain-containing protein [Cellulomonas sp. APG4]
MTHRHDVALMRLVAQRVVGPPHATPEDAVGHLLAVQAQDLPGSITSVALRTSARSSDAVRSAFDDGRIVRTWPMRGTLHTLRAEDVRWPLDLLAAGPMRQMARRRVELGLDDATLARARDLLTGALDDGGALTRAEVLALWGEHGISTAGGHGYHLLAHLAHVQLICLGPTRGKDQAFVLVDAWAPGARRLEPDEALGELALRFFRSHGPATVADLARWSGLPRGDVRRGIAAAGDALATLEVDGVDHLLDPEVPDLTARFRAEARGVHLLPGFDEIVLGYADRSATVPPEFADAIVPGGNGVFRPTVLHDGVAVGTWRRGKRRSDPPVTVEPFTELAPEVAAAVDERFAALP